MENYQFYILIFARVFGIFAFNPILSRNNVSSMVKVGTTVALTLIVGMTVEQIPIEFDSLPLFAVAGLKEVFVGLVLGFITQLFLSTILMSGEIMDMQAGLGMAKIYDPANGVQMPLFGSIMTYMFIMYYFAANAHLSYIKIFAISYDFIPVGFEKINTDIGLIIVTYFATILTLALKLAMPILVAELLLEICVGILMKAVPQIQVMVVNMQLKLLFGLLILFMIATPLSEALERYMGIMTDNLVSVLSGIATS